MNRRRSNNWSRRMTAGGMAILCAAGVTSLGGCEKKKPPAPPPAPTRQEEPPPPPVVSFDSISQEMKADARVQFAPDLKLSDEALARAVVSMADAIARGDADKVASLVSRPTRTLLTSMQSDGKWSEATGSIEAVRVVFIGENNESAGFKMSLDDITKMFSGEGGDSQEADRKIPPDVAREIGALFGAAAVLGGGFDIKNFEPPMNAEKLEKIREAWEKLRGDESQNALVQQIAALLASSTSIPGLKDAQYMVLMAVQSPDGVDLLGWGIERAFDKWTFNNASTDAQLKSRAADWDGVGVAGFSRDSRTGTAAVAAPASESGEKTEGGTDAAPGDNPEKTDEPGEQKDPPREKRTPRGPVKIPGGG